MNLTPCLSQPCSQYKTGTQASRKSRPCAAPAGASLEPVTSWAWLMAILGRLMLPRRNLEASLNNAMSQMLKAVPTRSRLSKQSPGFGVDLSLGDVAIGIIFLGFVGASAHRLLEGGLMPSSSTLLQGVFARAAAQAAADTPVLDDPYWARYPGCGMWVGLSEELCLGFGVCHEPTEPGSFLTSLGKRVTAC